MRSLATNKVEGLSVTDLALCFHYPIDRFCHVLVTLGELLVNDLVCLLLSTFLGFDALKLRCLYCFMTRLDEILEASEPFTGTIYHVE